VLLSKQSVHSFVSGKQFCQVGDLLSGRLNRAKSREAE